MDRPLLKARLDKSRQRVLCGAAFGRCRGQIGWVGPHPLRGEVVGQGPSGVWWLPQGWARRSDGVYHLGEYARRNIKRGFPAKHPYHPARMAQGNSPVFFPAIYYKEPSHQGTVRSLRSSELVRFPTLPCFAECPYCRRSQKIDPDDLDLEASPLMAGSEMLQVSFWYLDQPGGAHRVDWSQLRPITKVSIHHSDGRIEIMERHFAAAPDAE